MAKYYFFLFFISFASFGQKQIFTQSFITLDNESQFSLRSYQGYSQSLDSIFKKRKTFVGVANGFRYYDAKNTNNNLNESKFLFSSKLTKKLQLNSSASILFNQDWKPFVYDLMLNYQWKRFYLEGFSERELLGVAATNDQKLISNFYGLSVDYNPMHRLTLVTSFSYNKISDGNDRWFQVYRAIYTFPNEKIYVDYKTRLMRGGEYSEFYFSPNSITQNNVGVGVNTLVFRNRSYLKLYFGGGRQTIDNINQNLFIFDIRVSNQLTKQINSEAFFGVRNFNNYIYGFGTFKLLYKFK
jgi:hypothetical protein